MQLPEKRKPAPGKTGSLELSSLAANDIRENNQPIIERQAARIRERFRVSPPLGRAIAELAFAAGGAA